MAVVEKTRKINIKTKHMVILVIVLSLVVGISAVINASTKNQDASGYDLTISRDSKELQVFSFEEIKAMPAVQVEKRLLSGKHENENGVYTGVPLNYILNHTDKSLLLQCSKFITKAGDSFSSALSIDDMKVKNNVIVVYEKDGKALGHFKNGGKGPLRILIMEDTYGNRSTQYLIGVECR